MLDYASGHWSRDLKAVTLALVALPPHSPELDPAERVFRASRPAIEGESYVSFANKQNKAEAWSRGARRAQQWRCRGRVGA